MADKMQEQMDRLREALEGLGVPYEKHAPYVSFDNGDGECWVFPSQTYDDELVVRYAGRVRVKSADEALRACGMTVGLR